MVTGSSWQIEFYTTSRGTSPVTDFINGLPDEEQANIRNYLRLLREFGTDLGLPHIRPLTGQKPLWELRPMPNRLIYFLHTGRRFIILHAFSKKRMKTDKRHIETARRRMYEFLERER